MSVSAALKARVRRPSYLKKIAKAEDLIHHFPNDAYIGWSVDPPWIPQNNFLTFFRSGFTGVGYPK